MRKHKITIIRDVFSTKLTLHRRKFIFWWKRDYGIAMASALFLGYEMSGNKEKICALFQVPAKSTLVIEWNLTKILSTKSKIYE